MDGKEHSYGRIQVKYRSREEAMAEYEERIRHCEKKYGMSSEEMEGLFSTGEDQWDTVEILKWMSAYHAYQSRLRPETPTDGKISTTTESSTSGD